MKQWQKWSALGAVLLASSTTLGGCAQIWGIETLPGQSSGDGGSGAGDTIIFGGGTGGSSVTSTSTTETTTTTETMTTTTPRCSSDGECDDGNGCTLDTCAMGTCSRIPQEGFVIDVAANDCARLVCDANGNAATVEDTDDAPDDGNPCTADSCSGIQPVFQPLTTQLQVGQCGMLFCQNGAAAGGGVYDDQPSCIPYDSSALDCLAPICTSTMCSSESTAPPGWPCQRLDGLQGTCNGSGGDQTSCN
jgi:hypothetical protein